MRAGSNVKTQKQRKSSLKRRKLRENGIWRRKNLYLQKNPVFAVLIYPPDLVWKGYCPDGRIWTAEFDHTAKYWDSIVPTRYIKANFYSCRLIVLIYRVGTIVKLYSAVRFCIYSAIWTSWISNPLISSTDQVLCPGLGTKKFVWWNLLSKILTSLIFLVTQSHEKTYLGTAFKNCTTSSRN